MVFVFANNSFSELNKNNSNVEENAVGAGLYKVCTAVEITPNTFIQGPCSIDCGSAVAKTCAIESAEAIYPDAVRIIVISSDKISNYCF